MPDTVLGEGRSRCRFKVAEVPVVENNRFLQLGAGKIEIRAWRCSHCLLITIIVVPVVTLYIKVMNFS